ncbi:hypothetical protein HDU83_008125 [Entophlyctis luteolus]|nr:hypothetical protein HDU82_006322 [Entophlyctis luteolus]KAJ3352360.1 hypothetical protein HDU83_008125 [Entophlyctis luteolus]
MGDPAVHIGSSENENIPKVPDFESESEEDCFNLGEPALDVTTLSRIPIKPAAICQSQTQLENFLKLTETVCFYGVIALATLALAMFFIVFLDDKPTVGLGVVVPGRSIEIHLMGQWYWPRSQARAAELVRALAINTNNSAISKLHMIQPCAASATFDSKAFFAPLLEYDSYFPMKEFERKLIVAKTGHTGRLRASDAFRYASYNIKQNTRNPKLLKVAILANQDIFFDESLRLIETSPYSDLSHYTAYFLSRYEEPDAEESSLIGTQCGPKFIGSHDAFVVVPPLPNPLVDKLDFELGSYGIEARILWEFEQFGIYGRNPCEDIKIWHVHRNGIKEHVATLESLQPGHYGPPMQIIEPPMPEVNTGGKSSIAFPEGMKPKYKRYVDEVWGMKIAKQ